MDEIGILILLLVGFSFIALTVLAVFHSMDMVGAIIYEDIMRNDSHTEKCLLVCLLNNQCKISNMAETEQTKEYRYCKQEDLLNCRVKCGE